MLKNVLLTISFFLGCSTIFGQPDIVPESLAKKIKLRSVTKETFIGINTSPKWKEVQKYNADGKVIEKIMYDSIGSVSMKFTYFYKRSGRLIKERASYKAPDGTIWVKDDVKFDKKGLPTRNTNGKITHKYDKSGRPMEGCYKNFDGSDNYKIVYSYDSSGNTMSEKTFKHNNNLVNQTMYRYNLKGQIIEVNETIFRSGIAGNKKNVTSITYDDQGLISVEFRRIFMGSEEKDIWTRRYTYEYAAH